MKSKLALFMFALGLASSSAFARLPDCEWNCYLDNKACKAAGGGAACATEYNECNNLCKQQQPWN